VAKIQIDLSYYLPVFISYSFPYLPLNNYGRVILLSLRTLQGMLKSRNLLTTKSTK